MCSLARYNGYADAGDSDSGDDSSDTDQPRFVRGRYAGTGRGAQKATHSKGKGKARARSSDDSKEDEPVLDDEGEYEDSAARNQPETSAQGLRNSEVSRVLRPRDRARTEMEAPESAEESNAPAQVEVIDGSDGDEVPPRPSAPRGLTREGREALLAGIRFGRPAPRPRARTPLFLPSPTPPPVPEYYKVTARRIGGIARPRTRSPPPEPRLAHLSHVGIPIPSAARFTSDYVQRMEQAGLEATFSVARPRDVAPPVRTDTSVEILGGATSLPAHANSPVEDRDDESVLEYPDSPTLPAPPSPNPDSGILVQGPDRSMGEGAYDDDGRQTPLEELESRGLLGLVRLLELRVQESTAAAVVRPATVIPPAVENPSPTSSSPPDLSDLIVSDGHSTPPAERDIEMRDATPVSASPNEEAPAGSESVFLDEGEGVGNDDLTVPHSPVRAEFMGHWYTEAELEAEIEIFRLEFEQAEIDFEIQARLLDVEYRMLGQCQDRLEGAEDLLKQFEDLRRFS